MFASQTKRAILNLEALEDRMVPSAVLFQPAAPEPQYAISAPTQVGQVSVDFSALALKAPASAAAQPLDAVKGAHFPLSWKNYHGEPPATNAHDAWSVYTHERSATMKTTHCTFKASDGQWTTFTFIRLKNAKTWIKFDKQESYIMPGQQSAYLLGHETMHLILAGYAAQQAQAQLAQVSGTGTATSSSKSQSIKDADKQAKQDFQQHLDAFDAQWLQVDGPDRAPGSQPTVGQAFDAATADAYRQGYNNAINNGADNANAVAAGQAAMAQLLASWQANYQSNVNPILQGTWTK